MRMMAVGVLLGLCAIVGACENGPPVFCDEKVDDCGGEGGAAPVWCGEQDCNTNRCYVGWTCGVDTVGNPQCQAGDYAPDTDDHNACTTEMCDPTIGWLHIPIPESEIDDGDPCTEDTCNEVAGVEHNDICG